MAFRLIVVNGFVIKFLKGKRVSNSLTAVRELNRCIIKKVLMAVRNIDTISKSLISIRVSNSQFSNNCWRID